MSKTIVILSVCATLSACVIYAPTYESDTRSMMVHYEPTSTLTMNVSQQTKEVSERVSQKPTQVREQRSLAVCGAFTLPREALKPIYLNAQTFETVVDPMELDKILGAKVKELQIHIDKLHSNYEQAHQKWKESCNDKLLR